MDWLKLYKGCATDVKWQLIARIAQTNVGTVYSIWCAILEHCCHGDVTQCHGDVTNVTSVTNCHGDVSGFGCEFYDAAFGYEEGTTQRVFDALCQKGLIADGRVVNWDKRQKNRTSAERTRTWRQKNAAQANVTPRHGDVTQCHGDVTNVTPRHGDVKIRGEEIRNIKDIKDINTLSAEQEESCSPLQPETLPEFIRIPLNDGTEYAVLEGDVEMWEDLYPAVDVRQQLRHMKGWSDANPKKRKTRSGIKRHIVNWLAGNQNKADRFSAPRPEATRKTFQELEEERIAKIKADAAEYDRLHALQRQQENNEEEDDDDEA